MSRPPVKDADPPSQPTQGVDPAVLDTKDAIARAAAAANTALDEAYARSETVKYGAKRTTPWATADNAHVAGDATQGWTIKWARFPTGGFEYEAIVTVSATGTVRVERATAQFSPD